MIVINFTLILILLYKNYNNMDGIVSMFKSCLMYMIGFIILILLGYFIGYHKSGKDYNKGFEDGVKATKIVYETKITEEPPKP